MFVYRDGIVYETDRPVSVGKTRDGHVVEKIETELGTRYFVTLKGTHWCAHGETVAGAIADAIWKDPKQRPSLEALVADIKVAGKKRKITLDEFRAITGACAEGCKVALQRAKIEITPGLAMTAEEITEKVSREWGRKLTDILGWQHETRNAKKGSHNESELYHR